MAKKNAKKKTKKQKVSNEPSVVNEQFLSIEFMELFGKVCYEYINDYCMERMRIGVAGYAVQAAKEFSFSVSFMMTDAFPALLACLPRSIIGGHEEKYFETINRLKAKYGNDYAKWSDSELAELQSEGNLLIFTVEIIKITRRSVKFTLMVEVELDSKKILIKGVNDILYSSFRDASIFITCENTEDGIELSMEDLFSEWLFMGDAWETAPIIKFKNYLNDVYENIFPVISSWVFDENIIANVGVQYIFYAENLEQLSSLGASPLKDKCAAMLGDMFTPGSPVGLVLFGDVRSPDAYRISLRGPMRIDPEAGLTLQTLFEQSEKCDLLYEAPVDMTLMNPWENIGALREAQKSRERNAKKIAGEIAKVLGREIETGEEGE